MKIEQAEQFSAKHDYVPILQKKKKKTSVVHILSGVWHCSNNSFEIYYWWQANKCTRVVTARNRCVSSFKLAPFIFWYGVLIANRVAQEATKTHPHQPHTKYTAIKHQVTSHSTSFTCISAETSKQGMCGTLDV